jgi:hypothetical protein
LMFSSNVISFVFTTRAELVSTNETIRTFNHPHNIPRAQSGTAPHSVPDLKRTSRARRLIDDQIRAIDY